MVHRFRRAFITSIASALVLTVTHAAMADCTSDADCKAGRICREGQCTSLSCATDKDCPGDLVCIQSRCAKEASSEPAPAPSILPPAPPPPAGAQAPAPQAPAPQAPAPQAQGGSTAQALSGMESMMLDCSTAANDPRCKGQKGIVLSETFVFPQPRQTFVQFSIHGAYNHGFLTGANIFSGGMDIGASLTHGLTAPLPGPGGGWYNALVVEALTGVYGGALVTTGSPTNGAGFLSVRPIVRLGVELDHFGAFDREGRFQRGVGFNAMYSLGADWHYLAGDFSGNELFAGHGPSVALMVGEYHPLTSTLVRGFFRVGLWHVPAADALFLNIGGGASFP